MKAAGPCFFDFDLKTSRRQDATITHLYIDTTQIDHTMAQLAPRLLHRNICRQCTTQDRTFKTATPKHEILSRPSIIRASVPRRQWQRIQPFFSTSKRTYKSVEEAKGRYKVGVSPPSPKSAANQNILHRLTPNPHSPSPGKQASSSSSPARA